MIGNPKWHLACRESHGLESQQGDNQATRPAARCGAEQGFGWPMRAALHAFNKDAFAVT